MSGVKHQYNLFAKPPADILANAVAEYQPTHIFALLSGGHDSLCATDLAFMHCNVTAAVHINTTIGIEETRIFVRETVADRGWPFIELYPPKSYRELVADFGFPGPGFHTLPYSMLKERCIRHLVRDYKTGRDDKIMLITGARYQESRRRMGNATEIKKDGSKVWVAPILYWSDDDKWQHMDERGLPENQVVKLMHMSGECLCGAFARPGELDELRLWFPKAAEEIDTCAGIARQCRRHDKWGEAPPSPPSDTGTEFMPLCFGCLNDGAGK